MRRSPAFLLPSVKYLLTFASGYAINNLVKTTKNGIEGEMKEHLIDAVEKYIKAAKHLDEWEASYERRIKIAQEEIKELHRILKWEDAEIIEKLS